MHETSMRQHEEKSKVKVNLPSSFPYPLLFACFSGLLEMIDLKVRRRHRGEISDGTAKRKQTVYLSLPLVRLRKKRSLFEL